MGFGVGSTTLGFGWSTGYIYFTVARQRRVVFQGRLRPWVSGKDIVLELLRRWGAKQSQGMSVEFVDAEKQLPIAYRNTIANMMAEAEALNGIFAPDEITEAWYREKGILELPYPRVAPGADARYEIDETLALPDVQPMIAKPFSPGNAFPADEVARERLTFDKAMIGSCTNGSYDDLLSAALVLRAARENGIPESLEAVRDLSRLGRRRPPDREGRSPALGRVDRRGVPVRRRRDPPVLVRPVFRTGARRAHAGPARDHVLQPELAEPHGRGRRGLPGEPVRRRGLGLAGYMAPPSELGLTWDPETFGV